MWKFKRLDVGDHTERNDKENCEYQKGYQLWELYMS